MITSREAFISQTGSLDPSRLVFLDESGFKVTLTRAYGWAVKGERPVMAVPRYGKNITLVGAIALDGVRALETLEQSLNGERFVRYLDEVLGPALNEGDIVVMDGPRVHRVVGVEEVLAKWGATPLYLPAYSPELNPIEMCWSVLKPGSASGLPACRPCSSQRHERHGQTSHPASARSGSAIAATRWHQHEGRVLYLCDGIRAGTVWRKLNWRDQP